MRLHLFKNDKTITFWRSWFLAALKSKYDIRWIKYAFIRKYKYYVLKMGWL